MEQVWGTAGEPDFSVDRWCAATCDLHMTPKYLAERRCINFLYIMQDVLPKSLSILSLPIPYISLLRCAPQILDNLALLSQFVPPLLVFVHALGPLR